MGASPLDPESSASTSSATPTHVIETEYISLQRSGFYQQVRSLARRYLFGVLLISDIVMV